jgi:uncharacterized protein YdhG (YjbR/CyaY superfamily)
MDEVKNRQIDDYIAQFPEEVSEKLKWLRAVIRAAAPAATETFSYQMPTYVLHGNLVHFAAFKKHIGFYPAPSGVEQFKAELSRYQNAKGSVQFPLDKPLPLELISNMVAYRVKENQEKARKKTLRTCSIGHQYYKSSDCPVCPDCEKMKSNTGPFAVLSAPAQRALSNTGIQTVAELAGYSAKAILQLHGIGKSSLPKLNAMLQSEGLSFKEA